LFILQYIKNTSSQQ